MSDTTEEISVTQETRSVMPGEEAMSAGIDMQGMSGESTEGTVMDVLPGEDPTAFGHDAMSGFDTAGMFSMVGGSGFGIAEMQAPGLDGMPGENGMGAATTDSMPGEELTTRELGKTGTEITGTFRLTLTPD